MRINRFIAQNTNLSRRKADELIESGKVVVNRVRANLGTLVSDGDIVVVDGKRVNAVKRDFVTVILHKPVGYVCSKDGQGSPTVYDLLPKAMRSLNIAGRLDKDSSGLVVFTDDGLLLQELTHPSHDKEKVYIVSISKTLADGDIAKFAQGVNIGDSRVSKLEVLPTKDSKSFEVRIHEGRNRQIRRSFEALGYQVVSLHRIQLGHFSIDNLSPKQYKIV
ncbi:rRNA pseudouridine synthase [Candidatus Saccharibacteria bacterium]|nr:rRNA pseudouridine synthase [Candidatus Saccharibacteria bacterium]